MATLYVGADKAYTTINAAIEASNPGDTIIVEAGDYSSEGAIVLDKNLTLQAAEGAEVIVDHVSLGRNYNDAATEYMTVKGLTLKPKTVSGNDWQYSGVYQNSRAITAITIEDCIFDFTSTPDDKKSVGIKMSRSDGGDSIESITITGNKIIGNDKTQSYISVGDKGSITSVLVEGNECWGGSSSSAVTLDFGAKTTGEVSVVVKDNKVADVTNGHGINFGNVKNSDIDITVTGNTVENVTGEDRAAINMHNTSTEAGKVTVSDNVISDCLIGVNMSAVQGVVVSDNTLTDCDESIIYTDGSVISGNTVDGEELTFPAYDGSALIVCGGIAGETGDTVVIDGKSYVVGTNAYDSLPGALNNADQTDKIEIVGDITEAGPAANTTVELSKALTISGGNVTWTSASGWVYFCKAENAAEDTKLIFDGFALNATEAEKAFFFDIDTVIDADSEVSIYNAKISSNSTVEVQAGGKFNVYKEELQIDAGSTLKITGSENFTVADAELDDRQMFLQYSRNVKGTIEIEDAYVASYQGFYIRDNGKITADNSLIELGNDAEGVWYYNPVSNGYGELRLNSETAELNLNNGSALKVSGNVINSGTINIDNSTFVADGTLVSDGVIEEAYNKGVVTNNGTINVSGESTLDIAELTGTAIDFMDGAIIKDSKVGGTVHVDGKVTFRGDNEFAAMQDFGPTYYFESKEAVNNRDWTVEAGASVKLTNGSQMGFGYGDKVTINGELDDAKTAYTNGLTAEDASLIAAGGIIAQGAREGDESTFTAQDAYVRIGIDGFDKSFKNDYKNDNYGTYNFILNNSVVEANSFIFTDSANGVYNFNLQGSVFKTGGQFDNTDVDSTFTASNSTVISTGTEGTHTNAGKMIFKEGSTVDWQHNFTNTGSIEVTGEKTVFEADALTNFGSITVGDGATFTADRLFTDKVEVSTTHDLYTEYRYFTAVTYDKNGNEIGRQVIDFRRGEGKETFGWITCPPDGYYKFFYGESDVTDKVTVGEVVSAPEGTAFTASGEVTLKLNTVSGLAPVFADGTTLVDSNINYTGSDAMSLNGVTFKGDNTLNAASYSTSSAKITVAEGGSLTATGGRWAFGGNADWDINGSIENVKALTAEEKAALKASLNVSGISLSTGGGEAVMNVDNAYVTYGSGAVTTKNTNVYDGKMTLNFTNSYLASGYKISVNPTKAGYDAEKAPEVVMNFKDSVVEINNYFTNNHAKGTVTIDNTDFTATAFGNTGTFSVSNGSKVNFSLVNNALGDWAGKGSLNAGTITVDASDLTIVNKTATLEFYNVGEITLSNGAKFTLDQLVNAQANDLTGSGNINTTFADMAGSITIDATSLLTVTGKFVNNGTITIDGANFAGGTKKVIDLAIDGSLEDSITTENLGEGVSLAYGKDGDVFITDAATEKLLVNSAYADKEFGAVEGDKVYGVNAFGSLSDAVAAKTADTTEIVIESDVSEVLSGKTISGNLVADSDVTITDSANSTYVNFTGVTLDENITVDAKYFYLYGENTFNGDVKSSTTFYSSGKLTMNGNAEVYTTMSRYYASLEDGIYVVGSAAAGEGKNAAVQYKSINYLGHYSGTFSVKDTAAEFGYILLNGSNDGDIQAQLVLDNAKVSTIGGPNTQPGQVMMNDDATIIATNDSVLDFRGPKDFGYISMTDTNSISLTDSTMYLGKEGQGTNTLAGSITLKNSTLNSLGKLNSTAAITIDATSSIVATTITGTGTITIDVKGYTGDTFKAIDVNSAIANTVKLTNTGDKYYLTYGDDGDVYVTKSPEFVYVSSDYNSSTEGWGVTRFANYDSAVNFIKNNARKATMVIEKTITLSGNCFADNKESLGVDLTNTVIVKDGAVMGNAQSKWDMTYAVTIEGGGILQSARPATAGIGNTHIKNKLTIGDGSDKQAKVLFINGKNGVTYKTMSIALLSGFNRSLTANNALIEVGDLGIQATASFTDTTLTIDGILAIKGTSLYKTTMTDTEVTIKGHNLMNENTYYSTVGTILATLTMDNSSIVVDDGNADTFAEKVWLGYTGNVAQTLTMTNGSSITIEEGTEVEVANKVVMTDSSLTVGDLNAGTTKAGNSSFYFNQLEKGQVYYAVLYDAEGNELETIVRTSTSGSTFYPKFSSQPVGEYTAKCFKDEAKTELHQEKTYEFTAVGTMDLTNSDLYGKEITLAGNNLTMDINSTVGFTGINGGYITVKDAASYVDNEGVTDGTYKLFDYTGDGEMTADGYKAILNDVWHDNYLVFNNDLYLTDQDMGTLYVNGEYAGSEKGKILANGSIYEFNAFDEFADIADKIATDGSDTVIKLESNLEAGDVVFNYGSGDITFTADKAVTVKQNVAASDWDFAVGDVNSTITIGKNVTFQINENASGLYVYYGAGLNIEGTLTGGANWGCAYLAFGDHQVAESGELSTGRVHLAWTTLTVNGKLDTNYLLAEESTFTANKATVDAAAIHDSNNGGLRYGASEFSINDSDLTANSVTLKHADTKFNVNGGSFKIAGTFTNAASATFTKAEGNIGTMDNDSQLKLYESSVTFGTFDNSGAVDFTSAKAIADSATNTGDIKANNTSILFKEFNNAEGTVSVTGGTYLEIGKLTGEIDADNATITGSVVGGTLNVTGKADVKLSKGLEKIVFGSLDKPVEAVLDVTDWEKADFTAQNGTVDITGKMNADGFGLAPMKVGGFYKTGHESDVPVEGEAAVASTTVNITKDAYVKAHQVYIADNAAENEHTLNVYGELEAKSIYNKALGNLNITGNVSANYLQGAGDVTVSGEKAQLDLVGASSNGSIKIGTDEEGMRSQFVVENGATVNTDDKVYVGYNGTRNGDLLVNGANFKAGVVDVQSGSTFKVNAAEGENLTSTLTIGDVTGEAIELVGGTLADSDIRIAENSEVIALKVAGDAAITNSFVASVEVAADTTLTVIDEVTFGSLLNNGNVSMTGYDTLTVNGDFATDGMIIVDLSDFSGKNKVLDLNLTESLEGNANIKFEGKTDDTWISYEDDGDITVIKADMTTLVVDEDFAGASKFDEVEPGLVFGLNAVAKPEDLDWRENTGKVIIRDGVYNAFDIDQDNSVEIVTEAADGKVVELANTNISSDVTVSDIFAVTGDVNVAENALVDVTGTLAIDGEITNAGNIAVADGASFSADLVENTGSVALKGNVTVDAEIVGGKVTLASDSVLNGNLTADEVVIGYKGAALAADAILSAAVTGGALSIGGNDNTLNIKDGSDSKLIITEDSAFMEDDCLGNVFMTGAEGKDITITAVDSAFNGNTVENAKLIITEADGLIKVNTDIANIISINGNELEQIYGVYFYKAGDDFMFVTKTDDNFVAVTNGAGDVEVKTDEIGNFTVKEDYTEFANVNMVMAAGKTTVTVKNGKKTKNEIDYMEFAVGGILKSKKGGSNIVKFGNYNDISIKGDIESIAKLTVGNNSLVNIGGDVKAQNTNSTVTIGKDSIVEIGGDVALAGGKNTMKIGARSSVTLGGSLEDVSTFTVAGGKADKRTVFSIGGNFDAADVNNKLTMGNYVDFSVGAVDGVSIDNGGVASATGSTIKLGKESTMTLAGAANGIAKLTVGKNSVVTIGSDNNGLSLGGTEKSNAVSFGDNVRFTATGDIDLAGGKNSLTFGKNNIVTVGDIDNVQTIKIGSKSSFEADVISNANAVTVGGGSSFTADSFDNVSKFTLAAGKVDAFTQANINGDVVMTGRGDSFKLGSNSKVVVDGEIVMGDGKDTISLGKNSTLQLKAVSGVDVLNATASSTMLFANGKGEDVLLGNVTGSWNKAMIIDEEGELELGFNTGSVYGNEFDCYEVNVDTFKTLTFENISEGVEIQYSYNLNGTWTEWVDYTEDGLKAPGDYRIFVSVSGDYADKYDKLNYSLDAKIA